MKYLGVFTFIENVVYFLISMKISIYLLLLKENYAQGKSKIPSML